MQAYATKTFLEKNGYEPVLMEKTPFGFDEDEIELNRKKHPEFEKDFLSFMNSLAKNDSLVPDESKKAMDEFRENVLQVKKYTMEQLRELAKEDGFAAFITGSDQVWNTTVGIVNELFFLKFVPAHKRIALCPSFGLGSIHDYLRDDMREALNGFDTLSSREDEEVAIIKELT